MRVNGEMYRHQVNRTVISSSINYTLPTLLLNVLCIYGLVFLRSTHRSTTVHSSQVLKTVSSGVSVKTLKHITVNERNYHTLKRLGNAGDSFNDVVTKLLKKLDMEEESDEEEEAGVND